MHRKQCRINNLWKRGQCFRGTGEEAVGSVVFSCMLLIQMNVRLRSIGGIQNAVSTAAPAIQLFYVMR